MHLFVAWCREELSNIEVLGSSLQNIIIEIVLKILNFVIQKHSYSEFRKMNWIINFCHNKHVKEIRWANLVILLALSTKGMSVSISAICAKSLQFFSIFFYSSRSIILFCRSRLIFVKGILFHICVLPMCTKTFTKHTEQTIRKFPFLPANSSW